LARTSTHRQVGGEGGRRTNRQKHCMSIKGKREGGETGRGMREHHHRAARAW